MRLALGWKWDKLPFWEKRQEDKQKHSQSILKSHNKIKKICFLVHHHHHLILLLLFVLLIILLVFLPVLCILLFRLSLIFLLFSFFSTLLTPLCCFAVCSCLSCTPSFCLFLFFLSVLFSFFSTSSSTTIFFSPYTCWGLLCFLLCLLIVHNLLLDCLLVLIILLPLPVNTSCLQFGRPHPQKTMMAWNPYKNSGLGQTHSESRNAENPTSKSVREKTFSAHPRKGRCTKKGEKPQKMLLLKGNIPKTHIFQTRQRTWCKKTKQDQKTTKKGPPKTKNYRKIVSKPLWT